MVNPRQTHHRILLTGAAGGLGTALRSRLLANCEVLRLSDKTGLGEAQAGEEIVLADLADIWDSSLLRVSTLSLLGLYLAQGFVKEIIGEEFDLSRWFE